VIAARTAHTRSPVDISHSFDLHLQTRIDQLGHLYQCGRRTALTEVLDAQRIDERALGDVGHEYGDLDDMFCLRARVPEASIDAVERYTELLDRRGGNRSVCVDPDAPRHPDVRSARTTWQ